jgi:hypothetical protein
MSEFCVKCVEKEAEMELLRLELYNVKKENEHLQSEVDALILDVAFYNGSFKGTEK